MRRGEVHWYKFQTPDKKRPVVILTRHSALDYLTDVTVAPITSTIRDIPSQVILTTEDGFNRDCAVSCDNIQTVSKSKIGSLIVVLSSEKLTQISKALSFALDL